jgi:hypothetical protein
MSLNRVRVRSAGHQPADDLRSAIQPFGPGAAVIELQHFVERKPARRDGPLNGGAMSLQQPCGRHIRTHAEQPRPMIFGRSQENEEALKQRALAILDQRLDEPRHIPPLIGSEARRDEQFHHLNREALDRCREHARRSITEVRVCSMRQCGPAALAVSAPSASQQNAVREEFHDGPFRQRLVPAGGAPAFVPGRGRRTIPSVKV